MSAIAFLRELLDAGLELEAALIAAERFERKALDVVDAKRAKDRDRKRNTRISEDSAESVDGAENADTPRSLPPSPQTPQPPTHTPVSINTRAREADFERFWAAYPRKTGKGAAKQKYALALAKIAGPDPPGLLLRALERVKATWTDAQFIPHPATWLHQGRWDDEPETSVIDLKPRQAHVPRPDAKFAAKEANLSRALAGAQAAARMRAGGG